MVVWPGTSQGSQAGSQEAFLEEEPELRLWRWVVWGAVAKDRALPSPGVASRLTPF